MSAITNEQMNSQSTINQIVLITARVINEGLKKDIFDYEDIIYHNFAKDAGYEDIYPEQDYLMTQEDAIKKSKEILPVIYEKLKLYCKEVINKKAKLLNQVNINNLYNIYNDGNCFPKKLSKHYLAEIDKANIDKIVRSLPIPIQYEMHIQPIISDNNFVSMKVADFAINCIDKMTISLIGYCCFMVKDIKSRELVSITEEKIIDKILMILIENHT